MYFVLLQAHSIIITLFLLIYLIKTILLLLNKSSALEKFSHLIKIPEIIISVLFLLTGIVLLVIKDSITFLQIIKLALVFASIPIAVVGFKKKNKILAVSSLVLIIISFGLGAMNKKIIEKIEISSDIISDNTNSDYDQIKHGEALFKANCLFCHSLDGHNLNDATDLLLTKDNESTLKSIILNGKNSMPSYKNVLNDSEADALVEYIFVIKGRPNH